MTEPKKPDPNNLAGVDLPILTEVDDGQVDIPDFDFSSELDQMSSSLASAEMPLEFPPELLEEARTAQPGEAPISLQDLPSLDLGDEAAPDAPMPGDHEFEFELEPLQAASTTDSGLEALMARAQFDEPGQAPAAQPADDLSAQIPELTLDDVLPEPSSSDTLSTAQPADVPTLVGAMFDQGEMAGDESAIPELTLDEVLEAQPDPQQTTEAAIPELILEEALADETVSAPEQAADNIPVLILEDVLADEVATEVAPTPEAPAIPELTLEEALADETVSAPVQAADHIPELILADVQTDEVDADAAPAAAAIPDLSLDDVLTVETGQDTPDQAGTSAIPEQSIDDELPASDPLPMIVAELTEPIAEHMAAQGVSDLPVTEMAETEPAVNLTEQEGLDDSSAMASSDHEAAEGFAEPEPVPEVVSALAVTEENTTDDQAVDDLVAAALPVDMAEESLQAEAVQEALSAAQDELTQDAAAIDSEVDEPAAFRSIPLDSLPHGVLGGGKGPSAEPDAPEAESELSLQDKIRVAERTLAQERLRQAMAQAREEAMQSWQPAVAEPAAEPVPLVAATESPPQLADAGRPVEIINVAGLASSPTPQPFNLPPVRKSYVTLVDEAMLIDSLYDKIMPRMKVELSLWLQDALDHQAKQMLSGVMHQLKEDYEMLFSETLRESLRQAIAEMGREDRAERY